MPAFAIRFGLVAVMFLAITAFAQEEVSLEAITKSPGQFSDRLIAVEGFCERWVKDQSSDINYFMLKDNYGYSVKVRTLRSNPALGQSLMLKCFVMVDARGGFYLDERERRSSGIGPGESNLAVIIGIAVGGVVFIILAVLLLMQLGKKSPSAPGGYRPAHQVQPRPVAPVPSFAAEAHEVEVTQKVARKTPPPTPPPAEPDTTYKVLPGRFTVEKEGQSIDQIKLYQVTAEPVFTIGRKSGPAMSHIRIDDPTISSEQAILRYDRKKFLLINKSSTNPCLVNDVELAKDESRELEDGSAVVMGEITLRFHR